MATLRPFQALRPKVELARKVAALPYDVYDRAEAKKIVNNEPQSFLAIDRPETAFEDDCDMYSNQVYEYAATLLSEWINNGIFIEEEKSCYYIYRLTMNGRNQTGLVGIASTMEYYEGIIKKHENTRLDKEADRINHVNICNAQTGPIFLAYKDDYRLNNLIHHVCEGEPVYDFISEDGVGHTIWIVNDDNIIDDIRMSMNNVDNLYIADGHHRCASAAKVSKLREKANDNHTGNEEYNYFLSVLFARSELKILDYNRVVIDKNGLTTEAILDAVGIDFIVEKMDNSQYKPVAKSEFGMYIDNTWYKLSLRDIASLRIDNPVESLDVSILQDRVLTPILGISDPKTDKRILFIGGIRGLDEIEKRVNRTNGVGFAMYPTTMDELFDVSDAGLLMPPKSTWFEPKLRSGLFIHRI